MRRCGLPFKVRDCDPLERVARPLDFPLELNNTDYLRRVVAMAGHALKPYYRAAVTTGTAVGSTPNMWI